MNVCTSKNPISLVFSDGDSSTPDSISGRLKAWGPGVWPTKKCFWKGWVALIEFQIRNKILTTQLYLAHELAFMVTKEAYNLWTKSYLLLLKINSAVQALHEEEKMPKSRTVAHLGLLHRPAGYCCCFLTVFGSPHGCEIFLSAVPAPKSWVMKRKEGWKGTVSGLETQDESFRIHSNDRAERKTAKRTLQAPCAMRLSWHNRPKQKSTFGFFF